MSCCNTCGSSQGCNCNYTVVQADNPVVGYSAANINLTGIGVYDSTNGTEFDFRGITSANNALIVTLDAPNNTVLLTMDIQQIIDDLPDATTTQRGVLETATDAEAQGKALDNKILTPLNLAAIGATSSFAGLIEIATNAEALAGASTSLAITPANMAYVNATQLATVVFADAVARAAAVPAFKGQFGYQSDTLQPYVAYSTVAGQWAPMLADGAPNVFTGNPVDIDVSAGSMDFYGTLSFADDVFFVNTAKLGFQAGSILDFSSFSFIKIDTISVPANSVLGTSGTAGYPTSRPLSNFISTGYTQTGYTTFANPATLRTCDTATVTLPQLAQIVGTLIEDLKAVKLPAT